MLAINNLFTAYLLFILYFHLAAELGKEVAVLDYVSPSPKGVLQFVLIHFVSACDILLFMGLYG